MRSRLDNADVSEHRRETLGRDVTGLLLMTSTVAASTYTFSSTVPSPAVMGFNPQGTSHMVQMMPISGAQLVPMEGRRQQIHNYGTTANVWVSAAAVDGTTLLSTLSPGQGVELEVINNVWVVHPQTLGSAGGQIGSTSSAPLGFYGATPATQPTSASEAAAVTGNAVSTSAGTSQGTVWGYSTSAQANSIVTLVNQLRSDLVTLGLIKGS